MKVRSILSTDVSQILNLLFRRELHHLYTTILQLVPQYPFRARVVYHLHVWDIPMTRKDESNDLLIGKT